MSQLLLNQFLNELDKTKKCSGSLNEQTIREKFNNYRLADYKEKVGDLLMRVTRGSVETVAIIEAMKAAESQFTQR